VTERSRDGTQRKLTTGNTSGGAGGVLRYPVWLLGKITALMAVLSAIAIGVAGCVLTWEATARYLFKIPSDWQDELAIFLLVGATFLSAAWVQERRGHIGIQALEAVLPARADRIRRYLSDIVTLAFSVFFSWKSWTLLIEAVSEGQVSDSAWGAPLWIPYGCMAVGMSMLSLVLLAQVVSRDSLRRKAPGVHA
jgi:TRAP-type C4-dicarboxylate transport system permease small subunit